MAKAKLLDLPCSYGNVNIGERSARIGITIDRSEIPLGQADKSLCERRLTGCIIAKPDGSGPDQGALPGLEDDVELKGVFDIKGISVGRKTIGAGLTFALNGLDVASLAHFAKRSGRFIVTDIEELPEPSKKGPGDEEDDDDDDDDSE